MAKAWHLVRRPQGLPTIDDFALHALPDLPLETDQLRVRNHWLSVDPYMRGRMNDAKSYAASFQLDQPMTGGAIGEVIESAMDGFAPGDIILHMGGWRDGGTIGLEMTPTKLPADLLAAGMPPQTFLHNMGLTGGTAWIGLLRIAAAKPGDTVFVSAAAGAVGSAVVQIAKAREMTVIGSAGGAEKCAWVKDMGADAVVDYKAGPLVPALTEALDGLGKSGVDVYFDNVGGDHLEAALRRINTLGRIPVCGFISGYNSGHSSVSNLSNIIYSRVTLRGFVGTDFLHLHGQFLSDMAGWLKEGKIKTQETVLDGIANAPAAMIGLMEGKNSGKMLVKLAD
ncbi:MAG: NADP-dependent oxidoreductase [Sphingopyxis terrae]|nr:NADP-dependent oxidoreductase [Sphingopyxis terrae]